MSLSLEQKWLINRTLALARGWKPCENNDIGFYLLKETLTDDDDTDYEEWSETLPDYFEDAYQRDNLTRWLLRLDGTTVNLYGYWMPDAREYHCNISFCVSSEGDREKVYAEETTPEEAFLHAVYGYILAQPGNSPT